MGLLPGARNWHPLPRVTQGGPGTFGSRDARPEKTRIMINNEKMKQVFEGMKSAGIDFAVFIDREGNRCADLTYLSGHPSDAALLASAEGGLWLFPWDATLARKHAKGVEIVELPSYGGLRAALKSMISAKAGQSAFTLAFPASTSWFTVDSFAKDLPKAGIVCRPDGVDKILSDVRSTKTLEEIAIMEKGFAIADEVIALLPDWLESNRRKNPREIDLAFFLQREMFERGTDGAREALLVANADRSSEVHQHPQAGFDRLFKPGLALIDFWMQYEGYYTDVTIPILFEPLTAAQEEIVAVVQQVYADTMAAIKPGAWIGDVSQRGLNALQSK